ncbi:hypothetical protein PVAG01_01231 [Phlyctema vagabunda]|uniref:Uncharacterized protein n=1 Tax=Phlyctema vagabunda TaxID=108571 RepID=A0ABR4PWK4_9HELO
MLIHRDLMVMAACQVSTYVPTQMRHNNIFLPMHACAIRITASILSSSMHASVVNLCVSFSGIFIYR